MPPDPPCWGQAISLAGHAQGKGKSSVPFFGFLCFRDRRARLPGSAHSPVLAFPQLPQPGRSITGGGQGRRRHDTDVAVFGFFPVLGHTVAWEHPGAAKGALPCPPAQLQPEVMLESFRELGSSLMLKAWEA